MSNFFDDLGEDRVDDTIVPSFHTVKKKGKKEVLDWLNTVVESLQRQAVSRNERQRAHLLTYRGAQMNQRATPRDSERVYKTTKIDKFIVNHLYNMTETKVSQMTRIKPAVDVLPANDEFEDRTASKVVKMLVNHLWYINNIDSYLQKLHRLRLIMGEAYLFIEWDKHLGDLHPDIKIARETKSPVYLRDENDEIVYKDDKPVVIKEEIKIGDVKYQIELPWRVFLQRARTYEEADYIFRLKVEPLDKIKSEYPSKSQKIKSNNELKRFDADSLQNVLLEEEVVVFYFWHKKTKECPEGYYSKFTKDVMLESGPLPYSHGDFPCERITDIDVPDVLNGVSRYEMCRPMQNMHNNLSTLLAKNIYLCGHAKWVMPRGACKIESLANDNTIVQYQGMTPPQLLQTNPNPPEAYKYRDGLREEMGQVFGVHGTSVGAPPPGITAGVALQFLNEQENERATSDIAKHNKLVECIARKSISVCGDYYETDDDRLLRIVGKDNEYTLRHFDAANLSKSYDIKVQNSSALPESKAGKTQRIIEMMQYNPTLLSNERWLDLLEMGNTDKMVTLITEAIRCADSENEDMLSGNPVAEPEEWEDHILHWDSHVRVIQRRSFKEETPIEVQEEFINHITTTEYAMFQKMKTNPLFEAKLAELPLFPIFYKGEGVPNSREQQEAMVQGASNRGEPVNNLIPGVEPTEKLKK